MTVCVKVGEQGGFVFALHPTFCAFIFLILVNDYDFVLLYQWPGCEPVKPGLELN